MNNKSDERLVLTYQEAYKFLCDKVGEDLLKKQLDHYDNYRPDSLSRVFYHLLGSLKNKGGHKNFIATVEDIADIVCDLDPKATYELYGDDWEKLGEEFWIRFGHKYKIDLKSSGNAWVQYTKGVLSGAKFLSGFTDFADFDKFVQSFFVNEFTTSALPMVLEAEIYGFGFALACDFLKEMGYGQYGKPDVHLKDIFQELGLVNEGTDYEIFKKIVRTGLLVNQKPVTVDKVYWLIGSGFVNDKKMMIPRSKVEFIELMKGIL